MAERVSVYISSTSRDLADYRKAAIESCLRLGFFPIAMEYFDAAATGATEGVKRQLDKADLYIGIIAYRYGYVEPGYDRSVVEVEYDYAGERGIDRLCFLVDPKYPWPADSVSEYDAQRLNVFKQRISQSLIINFFTTVDNFRANLTSALATWQQRRSITSRRTDTFPADIKTGDAPLPPGEIEQSNVLAGNEMDAALIPEGIIEPEYPPTQTINISSALSTDEVDVPREVIQDSVAPINIEISGSPPVEQSTHASKIVPKMGSRNELINDVVRQEDQLRFQVYVEAFVALIRAYETSLPLTIGIYGSWGMGKSFLLDNINWTIEDLQEKEKHREKLELQKQYPKRPRIKRIRTGRLPHLRYRLIKIRRMTAWRGRLHWFQIRYRVQKSWQQARSTVVGARNDLARSLRFSMYAEVIKEAAKPVPQAVHIYIVRFNAWEYSATEVIWPGLVRRIMNEFERGMGTRKRVILSFRKLWRNLRYPSADEKKRRMILGMVLLGIIVFILLGARILNIPLQLVDIVQILLVPVLIGGLFKTIIEFIRPMGEWITNLFQEREYGKYLDQMVDTSDDLKFLQQQLRDDERVLILIDDLDRCEPEKAVQMLQAIKLLLNFERFVVVMGIDARIITRAVEEHYKGVLGAAGASGYEYLDKIVQIPFRIPEPNYLDIENFLALQLSPKDGHKFAPPPEIAGQITGAAATPVTNDNQPETPAPSVDTTPNPPQQQAPQQQEEAVSTLAFEPVEVQAFQSLSRFLRPNPRHIKRMTNVYRLVRVLANGRAKVMGKDPATVITWVVMCGQWPYTTYMMLESFERLYGQYDTKWADYPNEDPLKHLYTLAKKDTRFSLKKQKKLDFDSDILSDLFDHLDKNYRQRNQTNGEGWMSWEELEELRRYTINFNPAIEAELAIEEENKDNQQGKGQGGNAASSA